MQAFIRPLRTANPPVIPLQDLDRFIENVFGNILDLRECNRRLLDCLYVRQREQAPVVQTIGDVFLGAATEFTLVYPIYNSHLPLAEKRMKDETDSNPEFRIFLEVIPSLLGVLLICLTFLRRNVLVIPNGRMTPPALI
jgi:RHO1 GDP-GTP exchange protein 1/2